MKVDEVLTKPVPLEHLVGKIEQYLSGQHAECLKRGPPHHCRHLRKHQRPRH